MTVADLKEEVRTRKQWPGVKLVFQGAMVLGHGLLSAELPNLLSSDAGALVAVAVPQDKLDALAAVGLSSRGLEDVPDHLKSDPEVVRAAVRAFADNFEFAPEEFKS